MLSARALNRSLLARQGLLEREAVPVDAMVERLVGLQAQVPSNPYVALWSRIASFDPESLSALIADGRALRGQVIRPTVHLVTARDHDALAPLNADVLARSFRSTWAKRMPGIPPEPVVAAGRRHLERAPLMRSELDALLAPDFPGAEPGALAQAATLHLPCVQVPPRGLWARSGQARLTVRDPAPTDVSVDDIIRRYLAAFGPATVADVRTWSGYTGLAAVIERLDLVTIGDALLDVPGAPYPDPDTPAPPRFLPEYDNLLLSHADRSRVVGARIAPPAGTWKGTLLLDGFTAAGWRVDGEELTIFGAEPDEATIAEGKALVRLITPGATPRVNRRAR